MEKTTGKWIPLLLILLMTASGPAAEIPLGEEIGEPAAETFIQDEISAQVTAQTPGQEDPSAVTAERLSPVQQRMQEKISVDFRDTPIDDVLRILARQADVDIIKSPLVEGNVTATLTDVPLSEALSNILEAHGYGYIASENMLRVMPSGAIVDVREKLVSRVYRITYADVKEVEQALRKFISEQGSLSANPGTSNIIVTDIESKIDAMNTFIEEIDRVTPQIMVEARIYDISSKDSMDLGVEWQMGTNTGYLLDDDVFINGAPLTDNIGNIAEGLNSTPAVAGVFSGNVGKTSGTDGLLRFGLVNDNVRLDAVIRAQKEDVRAKLLANPRILVLDNEQAEIKIVEEIPYQELTESSAGGQIGTTEFRDVGVELRVTPHLTRDGLIRMILNPKFSIRTGDVVIAGTNNASPQPIVASRETITTTLIRDGQTVVIGGLKKQDVSHQTNKVPLLGDLPLLGALFRSQGEAIINSELVIFITPHLITEPALTETEKHHLEETFIPSPHDTELKLLKTKTSIGK